MSETANAVSYYDVSADEAGQRIDNFLLKTLKGVPKSRVYRLLRRGEVRVNKGRIKPDYKLQSGDQVRLPPVRQAASTTPPTLSPQLAASFEAMLLYEDDGLLVLNKPAGLAVHGGSGIRLGLIESLRQWRPESRFLELVHRLDRDTSGCVMIAKKRSRLRQLHAQLRQGEIDKRYLALVSGSWPKRKQIVDLPLQKNHLQSGERMVRVDAEGKASRTRFSLQQRLPGASLVEASPITGRTHQIRVHARAAGHPILGDEKYSDEHSALRSRELGLRRLFLHAASLTIPDPQGGSAISVEAPLDDVLQACLAGLRAQL